VSRKDLLERVKRAQDEIAPELRPLGAVKAKKSQGIA
jgi:hypothetical protein